MTDFYIPLAPDGIYHLFSSANGLERLFREEENYRFFLEKTAKYILPIADIYSYSLLPTHFDFLVQIKPLENIEEHFAVKKPDQIFNSEFTSDFIMERFSNLLNCYAKSYNKLYQRKGSLFIDFLKRVKIDSQAQLCSTAFYIHKNPVHHGYCNSIAEWKWSSFWAIVHQQSRFVSADKLLQYFGDVEFFRKFHLQPLHLNKIATPINLISS